MILAPYKRLIPPSLGVFFCRQLWPENACPYLQGFIGDAYPAEGEATGKVITTQVIKSALALPWPAELAAGPQRVHGYAHSPFGAITRVDWSVDAGATWIEARVLEPQIQYSWARFEFAWNVQAREHTLMTRATDAAGNTQPDSIPFNEKGYLFNQPLPHPILVK